MAFTEKAIGLEQIQIISPYGSLQLTDFRICSKPDRHTQAYFCGMVAEAQRDSCVLDATTQDRVEINLVETGQKVRTIFKGVVTEVTVKTVRGIYYLEVEARSFTYLLDLKLKSRSFQNGLMSYDELFKQVLADYPGASYDDRATNGAKLEKVIIQYEETDWSLLARAASHCGAVLIPDPAGAGPRFCLGVPAGQERQLDNSHYSLGKNLREYGIASQNYDPDVAEIDFAAYRVESNQVLDLGDRVQFQGANLVIAEATGALQHGVLKFEYLLFLRDGLRQNKIVNKQLVGLALQGKVIDRRRDQMRLHLAIDKVQNKEEAYWFPLATRYTAEGNSGWYCLPELGDILQLYFANCNEESATVIGSLRQNGATNQKTAAPGIKRLGNIYGKELQMDDRQLQFSAKENQMLIRLDSEEGVTIQSDQMIQIESGNDIVWDAKTITLDAKQGVYLACQQSSIIIKRGVDIKAAMVRVEGLVPASVSNSAAGDSSSEANESEATNYDSTQDSDQSQQEVAADEMGANAESEVAEADYDSEKDWE